MSDLARGSVGWSEVAVAYDETFAPLCAGTVDMLLDSCGLGRPVGRPLRLLDVGTGTGLLAKAALAVDVEVTAVDPDPDMLRIAEDRAAAATFRRAGLPDLPFSDGAFDVVVANFVVNHLQDPLAGVRELVRVAAPGAAVAVTIWPSGRNVQSRLWAAVLEDVGVTAPASVRLPPERDFPRTVPGLADLLDRGGLRDVEARLVGWTHHGEPDTLWRGAAAGIGGIGTTVRSQSSAVRDRMRAAHDRLVLAHLEEGRLRLDTEAVLAVGRVPGLP